jgi:hypothetical protein
MKKTTLLLLLLCAIPVARLWEEGRWSYSGSQAAGTAFLLAPAASDFSDLDARDAQNHPIRTAEAANQLTTLFRENLLNLMVFANSHSITQAYNEMDSFLYLFNKSILSRLFILFEAFQEAFLPPTRRFVHNVHNLWITFSVGAFAGCLLISAFTLQRAPRTLNLRC